MNKYFNSVMIIVVIVTLIVVGCSSAATSAPTTTQPPDTTKGKSLVESRCSTCHSLTQVQNHKDNQTGWEAIVKQMVGSGAQLDAEQQKLVVEYLATTYPK
jgi:cytochrome c5